jgi:cell division protein FtsI/penicillin-binding protein 2
VVPAASTRASDAQPTNEAPTSLQSELGLDSDLSRAATRLLEQARPVEGAAVAVDVRTGRILAWSETRRNGLRGSVITSAKVPAASVFKLVTTAALLEAGGVQPSDRVCTSGGVKSIERRHLDSPRGGEQTCAPFSQALGHSRNAVYAQLVTQRLSRQNLIDVAERLGFNSVVPFDWPVPVGALRVPYNDLEFARTAAGFQGSTLSPLGGAYLASLIADGGVARRLWLHRPEPDPTATEALPELRVLRASTARRLTRMMEVTVHSGTSRHVFSDESGRSLLPGIRVAGKTGTLRPGTRGETTSWFIGFAPSQRPEIAVSVMLENGAVWRQRAAEVARDVLRVYFHRKGASNVVDPLAQ